jgi:hypothetical protein
MKSLSILDSKIEFDVPFFEMKFTYFICSRFADECRNIGFMIESGGTF